jgi:hypothetical protein
MKQMVVEETPNTRKRKGDDTSRQDMVNTWKAKNNKRAN